MEVMLPGDLRGGAYSPKPQRTPLRTPSTSSWSQRAASVLITHPYPGNCLPNRNLASFCPPLSSNSDAHDQHSIKARQMNKLIDAGTHDFSGCPISQSVFAFPAS